MEFTTIINHLFSLATIVGDLLIIVVIMMMILKYDKILHILKKYALPLMFISALAATLGSLTYSDIIGYDPCKLCWFQRIFMYPQTLLLGIALLKKDTRIATYIFWLSLLGFVLALYHYLLQIGVATGAPCSVVGYSETCSKRFVLQYGYITIPMMAATAFGINLLTAWHLMKHPKK